MLNPSWTTIACAINWEAQREKGNKYVIVLILLSLLSEKDDVVWKTRGDVVTICCVIITWLLAFSVTRSWLMSLKLTNSSNENTDVIIWLHDLQLSSWWLFIIFTKQMAYSKDTFITQIFQNCVQYESLYFRHMQFAKENISLHKAVHSSCVTFCI